MNIATWFENRIAGEPVHDEHLKRETGSSHEVSIPIFMFYLS